MVDKIAVILGAGAAHDVSSGSKPTEVHFRPPLVRDLFGVRARDSFMDVLDRYKGASLLYDELFRVATAETETLNLETKLQEYAQNEDERIARAFRSFSAALPTYGREAAPGCASR